MDSKTLIIDIIKNDDDFKLLGQYFNSKPKTNHPGKMSFINLRKPSKQINPSTLKLEDIKNIKIRDLIDVYFYDSRVNNEDNPLSPYLMQQLSRQLDLFIKKYLLSYLQVPSIKENDGCCDQNHQWIEDLPSENEYPYISPSSDDYDFDRDPYIVYIKELKYSCLGWRCQSCYKDHIRTFICHKCSDEYCAQCECGGGSGGKDYCRACYNRYFMASISFRRVDNRMLN